MCTKFGLYKVRHFYYSWSLIFIISASFVRNRLNFPKLDQNFINLIMLLVAKFTLCHWQLQLAS